MHTARKLLGKSRDALLGRLYIQVDSLRDEIAQLSLQQKESNKKQLDLYDELNRIVKNSRTIQLSSTEVMTKIFSGAKMYLDPRDVAVVPHLVLDGEWEHDITHAWLKCVRDGDVILDIGANFGYFGLLAAQQANRDCRAVLFEANPNLIPYLTKTLEVNSMQRCCSLVNVAVADKKGELTLSVLKDYIGSSSVHSIEEINDYNETEYQVEKKIKVPSLTVDEYSFKNKIERVNLIKMDIEGFEDKAYEGMRDTIARSPDVTLFIEFTHKAYKNPKRFYKRILKDFQYVYKISPEGNLSKVSDTGYDAVIGGAEEWVMPVFSKRKDLA